METFRYSYSTNANGHQAVTECLQQIGTLPDEATLGFLYVTDELADQLGNILKQLKQDSPIQDWVGTIGLAVCCTSHEFYDEPAMVMMITDIPSEHYRVFRSVQELKSENTSSDVRVAVVHGDPRNGQLANLLQPLADQIGNGYLVGGLTSANRYHYQLAGEIEEGSLSGVVFEPQVNLINGLTQGCTPIGQMHTLTECDSNIAIKIDGRPALDVMKEDIGEVLARDLHRVGGYIFAGFPLAGHDTRDYTVRNLLGIDPHHGAIAIGEYLQQDSPIMFCKRDGTTAVEDLRSMAAKLRARCRTPIKGGLYFSCLGRGQHMFGEQHRELRLLGEELGDVPLIGFYANGEIAANQLYGYTGVLLLFCR